MRKLALSFLFLGLAPTVAFAQQTPNPLVVGNTEVGTHPNYGASYSAFWRAGADYSLLTDATNTFVNAPSTSGAIYFRNANGNRMYVDRNGLTNIGQLLQVGSMYVNGPATFTAPLTFSGVATFNPNATFNQGLTAFPLPRGYAGDFLGGQFGVETTGTVVALSTTGPSYFAGDATIQNGGNLTIDGGTLTITTGNAYKPGGGTFLAYSDRRVKKDIAEFDLGLADIERLHPIRFKYNGLAGTADNGQEYVGVVAQELEEVAPFMVSTKQVKLHKGDTTPTAVKQVDASAFTYMLVNAVQELASQNKELQRIVCQDHPTEKLCAPAQRAASAELADKIARAGK